MIKFIDRFLNNITMYRLMLYYLIFIVLVAVGLSFFGLLAFNALDLIYSTLFLVIVSWVVNSIFSAVFSAPTNVESVYITALILALIISPIKSLHDLYFLFWVATLAMATKYILALKNKHLFNPAAIAVVITALAANQSASWWVGTAWMMPFVLIGGLLIVRKIRRGVLVTAFLLVSFITIMFIGIIKGTPLLNLTKRVLFDSPLFFLACVMLTEPLTMPPTRQLQIIYGALVGFLFAPQLHFFTLYSTPELALVMGNVFSYLASPKDKLILTLKDKLPIAPDIFDFIFVPNHPLSFSAGQYLEWTLAHNNPDSRGNRRYFTIASAPTEPTIRIGVKYYENASSFKRSLFALKIGDKIVASQLAGDFTLAKSNNQKLVFIAGGIGVTPFRSMLKYLVDTNQQRDIVMFYSNKISSDIVYTDVFSAAQRLGLRTVYALTDIPKIPTGWPGKRGFIDAEMIKQEVPDFLERIFYISGPNSMVTAFRETLKKLGISNNHIVTDYFPGF